MGPAVYPGTFDPITNGHLDLVKRSLSVFEKIIIGVAVSNVKKPLFTVEERVELVRESTKGIDGVEIVAFDNLLTDFCMEHRATVVVRGLRAVSDFEYELQLSQMNRNLNDKIESVFMMPSEEHTFLSSKIIKEVASFGGDVSKLVPAAVKKALKQKFGR